MQGSGAEQQGHAGLWASAGRQIGVRGSPGRPFGGLGLSWEANGGPGLARGKM